MEKKILLAILFFFFASSVHKVEAANFIDGKDQLSNNYLSATGHLETSIHTITFTTVSDQINGSLRILIPAANSTVVANDGRPDTGTSILFSGFDLNKLEKTSIICSGGVVTWQQPIITSSADTTSQEHEIVCPFTGSLKAGSNITIVIGDNNHQLINPEPTLVGQKNSAEIYKIDVRLLDTSKSIIDRINVEAILVDKPFITTGIQVGTKVGDYSFSLYGYTSPQALVFLESFGIKEETTADETGYFVFTNLLSTVNSQEPCLYTKDTNNKFSTPICLAPIVIKDNLIIGPVLMPPTISLDRGQYLIGEEGKISGQTVPNSEVKVVFFNNEKVSSRFLSGLIKPVYALNLPEIKTKSDARGNYSLSTPTTVSDSFKVFANANFLDSPSPKSLTLTFEVSPWWLMLLKILLDIFLKLLPFLVLVTIIIAIIEEIFDPLHLHKIRALALRQVTALKTTQPYELVSFKEAVLKRLDD